MSHAVAETARVRTTHARILIALTICALALGIGVRFQTSIWRSTSLGCALPLALLALWFRPVFARLLPRSAREAALGVGAGLAMAVATWVVYPLAIQLIPGLDAEVRELYGEIAEWPGRLYALPLLLAIVVAEECVFRGVLMDELLRVRARTDAVLLGMLVYTLPLLASGSYVLVLLALGCGAIWSAQRAGTNSVAVPFLTHLTWDVLVFVLWPVR